MSDKLERKKEPCVSRFRNAKQILEYFKENHQEKIEALINPDEVEIIIRLLREPIEAYKAGMSPRLISDLGTPDNLEKAKVLLASLEAKLEVLRQTTSAEQAKIDH